MNPNLLYISHTLSTWNSRAFQFGSVLLIVAMFPGTLLPVSIYALVSALPGALFAGYFGTYIDNNPRLPVVRNSILGQRIAVMLACALYVSPITAKHRWFVLAVLSCLGGLESAWSIINTVSVERDWVIVVAGTNNELLRKLNSRMRAIDLLCKLLGPFAVGMIASRYGARVTALAMTGMNAFSCWIEYYAIVRVYNSVPGLASKPHFIQSEPVETDPLLEDPTNPIVDPLEPIEPEPEFSFWKHRLLLVSLAMTCTYITVLSFSGQMVSFLLATGMPTAVVTYFKTGSVLVELAAALGAPKIISRWGPVRTAAGFVDFQWLVLSITAILFVNFGITTVRAATALAIGVAISRIGLWGFDLCTQIIIQDGIKENQRGRYSTMEKALQNWAIMLVYVSTMVFSKPSQFVWPVLLSVLSVGIAAVTYNYYQYART